MAIAKKSVWLGKNRPEGVRPLSHRSTSSSLALWYCCSANCSLPCMQHSAARFNASFTPEGIFGGWKGTPPAQARRFAGRATANTNTNREKNVRAAKPADVSLRLHACHSCLTLRIPKTGRVVDAHIGSVVELCNVNVDFKGLEAQSIAVLDWMLEKHITTTDWATEHAIC